MKAFLDWFQTNHGVIDLSAMSIIEFPGHGRGGVALRDISEGETIFTIPRSLTLSTRTSALSKLLGDKAWKEHDLHHGWVGLILCMLWEESQGPSSKWFEYLASLPSSFDTPMFWNGEDLKELKGTAVVDKIGREDAEHDYHEKLLPVLHSRPDIFSGDLLMQHFSMERYHMMGSRILSRSFHVERWDGESGEDDDTDHAVANSSGHSGMDVDEDVSIAAETVEDEEIFTHQDDSDSDDEDQEDPSDVAMVPMADILNARYGSENVKLFYEEKDLKMVATKAIKTGEQIWNTYGDPPNSDLLRRYGHVDLLSLPGGGEGNPADVTEVRADLVVDIVSRREPSLSAESRQERIDWWLEEGGDDIFILETNLELPVPEAFISLIRLLLFVQGDWEKTRDKGKPPKPKIDAEVLSITISVLKQRLEEYPTSMQVDENILMSDHAATFSLNKKHALVVRLGEKRVLHAALTRLEAMEQLLTLEAATNAKEKKEKGRKRKGGESEAPQTKKSRR